MFFEMQSKFLVGEYSYKTELKALLYKLPHRVLRDLLMEDTAELAIGKAKHPLLISMKIIPARI